MKPTDSPVLLIVDDVLANIQVLAEHLKHNYRIRVANNGKTALELAQYTPSPDLILLDIMMPDMDGYEVCQQLKRNVKTQAIPVIFVTAKDSVKDEEYGLNLGAVDYITKPFHLAIIEARIRTHIRLKRHADMLEQLAQIDPLTHLPNRRRINDILMGEFKRAQRDGTPLAVLMIDIDYFKDYNDHYGHGQGDLCLQSVAAALAAGIHRPADLVGRFGGEEFVAILPDTSLEDARHVGERLCRLVAERALIHDFSSVAQIVTISVGGAELLPKQSILSPDDLIDAADVQLYAAKQKGRNCVCT